MLPYNKDRRGREFCSPFCPPLYKLADLSIFWSRLCADKHRKFFPPLNCRDETITSTQIVAKISSHLEMPHLSFQNVLNYLIFRSVWAPPEGTCPIGRAAPSPSADPWCPRPCPTWPTATFASPRRQTTGAWGSRGAGRPPPTPVDSVRGCDPCQIWYL